MAEQAEQIEFVWQGLDRTKKKAKGEITAISEESAKIQLTRQGYHAVKIRVKPKPLFSSKKTHKIRPADIAVFSRQLATMIHAGVPLVQAFDIVGRGHDNPAMCDLLLSIKADVEAGDTLAQALNKRPVYFDELFCNLVQAGEQAGVLETLLDKIATYKEKTESMKKKIKKALTYPISVIVIAFIVTAVLLVFVVPVFEDLFKGFGADLPVFTKMIISMSKWMQSYWYMVVGTIFG